MMQLPLQIRVLQVQNQDLSILIPLKVMITEKNNMVIYQAQHPQQEYDTASQNFLIT